MKNAVLGTCLSALSHVFLYARNVLYKSRELDFIPNLSPPPSFRTLIMFLCLKKNLVFPQKST